MVIVQGHVFPILLGPNGIQMTAHGLSKPRFIVEIGLFNGTTRNPYCIVNHKQTLAGGTTNGHQVTIPIFFMKTLCIEQSQAFLAHKWLHML